MSDLFQGTAREIQFVENSDWKRARKFTDASDNAQLKAWLARAVTFKIALEICFEDDAGQLVFFGIRLFNLTKRREICMQALEYFGEPEKRNIQDFLRDPHSPFVGFPFMRDQPELLELGVVHDWRSLGPVKFWKKNDTQSPEQGLRTALGAHTHYRDQLFEQPLAIELAYQLPIPHWLTVVTSINQRGKYRIDLSAAIKLCQKVTQQERLI